MLHNLDLMLHSRPDRPSRRNGFDPHGSNCSALERPDGWSGFIRQGRAGVIVHVI
jgi:hypothetical protein